MKINFLILVVLMMINVMTSAEDESWKKEALERIEKIRKSSGKLEFYHSNGEVVKGLKMEAELIEHEFTFGTAINSKMVIDLSNENREMYLNKASEIFNTIVLENSHKWGLWIDPTRNQRADLAVKWAQENGLRIRGHTMLWQSVKKNYGPVIPKYVVKLLENPSEEQKELIRNICFDHIRNIGGYYRGQFAEWDVVNEQVTEHAITEALTPETPVNGSPDMVKWFQLAKKVDPNARLFINDFHILVGDFEEHKDKYEKIISDLLKDGAPLEGIGFQCHFHGQYTERSPKQIWETLERFGKFNLPLVITEFDAYGKGWGENDEEKYQNIGKFYEKILLTSFSHPKVDGFMVWGFWDGRHWNGDAPFFTKDWKEKSAFSYYKKYVLGEWMTKVTLTTDDTGKANLHGFRGTYRLRFTYEGKEQEMTCVLNKEETSVRIVMPFIKNKK